MREWIMNGSGVAFNRSPVALTMAAILLVLARSSVARCQTSSNVSIADHGFVGLGVLGASDDRSDRVRFPDQGPSGVLFVEANFFRVGRAGFGVELLNLGTVTGSYDALCCILRDKQNEFSALAVVRERAWRRNRLTVDIIGAAGVLFQHRETSVADRFSPAATAISTIEDRRSPAFAVGMDLPLLLARHVSVAPQARVYFLQRGGLDSTGVTRASSTRPTVGLSGRVMW
jgi:hypothetical protein